MLLLSPAKKCISSFIVLLGIILSFGCQKEFDSGDGGGTPPENKPDLTTKVMSSVVSGFVTDENDKAVKSASVEVGGVTTTTDKYGYFEVRNVQVVQNAATVSITKPGYFKAIKTYIATQGKNAFFRIKLLPKNTVGNINAATGGSVTLTNGLIITLPANAVVNANTNAAYSGSINVAAQLISATDPNLNRIMPGDLRGLNTDNDIRILTTYGMAAVELTGAGGELLQIASGKKATLTIQIPASLQATAPQTIPLWSFNENNGLWKEEGAATKTGNTYVGEVSHFSYWNYDVPANFVLFNCTLVNQKGQPIQHALVKISVVNKPNSSGSGYTDSAGYTGGAIPNNSQLLMEVFSSNNCNAPVFAPTFQANVTGTATNCANTPLATGYVILQIGNQNYRYPVTNGVFNFNSILCSAPTNVTIVAEDVSASQQSTAVNYSLIAGDNAVGNIQACGVTTQQFINYTINGISYSYSSPIDTFFYSNQNTYIIIQGETISPPRSGSYMLMDNANIAVGTSQSLIVFDPSQINDSTTITTPIMVNITEYGAPGQFVAGNFTGTFRGSPPSNTVYNVTYSFRIRRRN
jgi:hypothetical protein